MHEYLLIIQNLNARVFEFHGVLHKILGKKILYKATHKTATIQLHAQLAQHKLSLFLRHPNKFGIFKQNKLRI